jgi:hypothetical protein
LRALKTIAPLALEHYGAEVIHPPKRNSKKPWWSKRLRRWVARIRQIVQSV